MWTRPLDLEALLTDAGPPQQPRGLDDLAQMRKGSAASC